MLSMTGELEAGVASIVAGEPIEPWPRPDVADRHVVEGADDAPDAGDLSDVGERDRVGGPEPPEGHVHRMADCRLAIAIRRYGSR